MNEETSLSSYKSRHYK